MAVQNHFTVQNHFSDVLIDENLVLSFEPKPFTTEMIASAIPAAINPYSIAVAAFSSLRNRLISFMDLLLAMASLELLSLYGLI
jgi:hypothetical protein